MINYKLHEKWMYYALKEAEKAENKNEVPIGAVVIFENNIIGRGFNQVESLKDSTAHAEMIAITSASKSRHAETVSLTFSGTSRGTLLFDKKSSKNNFETLVSMINFIDRPPDNLNDGNRRGFLWNKLSPDLVTNFLRSYNYPVKDSKIFDPSSIADYIEKQIPYS